MHGVFKILLFKPFFCHSESNFIRGQKAFPVFHADRVLLSDYPAVKVNGKYNVIG